MQATVGICTWNRAELLEQTLAQLGQLHIPSGVDWEVLVVNNCCTDRTDDVLAKFQDALPLRRVAEGRPGKSHALNTAFKHARGELLLWTDDDVLVDRQWLAATVSAAEAHPECSFFGGPIEPWFSCPVPDWLLDNWDFVSSAYATRRLGSKPFEFSSGKLPYGANFSIRTATQRRFPYNPRLGRVGSSEVRGEETQVMLEMLAAGERGMWTPAAKVQHYIPPERISLEYLLRFFHGIGQTIYHHERVDGKPISEKHAARRRRRAIRRQCKAALSRWSPFSRRSKWVEVRLKAAMDWGYYEASRGTAPVLMAKAA